MKPTKCKNCGANDFVRKGDKYVCQYCGTEYPIPAEELEKEKKADAKKASQKSSAVYQSTTVSHSAEKSGYVNASPTKPPKKKMSRGMQTFFIVVIVVFVLGIIATVNSSIYDDNNDADRTVAVETETMKATEATQEATETERETEASKAAEAEQETELEIQAMEMESVDAFDYDISGNEIKLMKYTGDSNFLEISPTYTVDDVEYNTNVATFEIGYHNMNTIIFDEGITELYLLAFSDTCSEQVYLPSTLTYIYDKTLSYLRENREGGVVQVYYGGSEDQWNSIYTEYERDQVSQEEAAADLGASLANKINAIVEDGSDKAEYEYHFNASPDDLK